VTEKLAAVTSALDGGASKAHGRIVDRAPRHREQSEATQTRGPSRGSVWAASLCSQ
jgi:hypothetical protein